MVTLLSPTGYRTDAGWYITVTEKRRKVRELALLDAAEAVMMWLEAAGIRDAPDSPLFPALERDRKTPSDRPLSTRQVHRIVTKYAAAADIQVDRPGRGICTHSVRKTAAMDAIEHGAPVTQVQAWLGHSDIRTTQEYITYSEKDAESAARYSPIRPRE